MFSRLYFIFQVAIVDANKRINTQIRVMDFHEGSTYETLHSYTSNGVAPYFKSFVRKSGKADRYMSITFLVHFLLRMPAGQAVFRFGSGIFLHRMLAGLAVSRFGSGIFFFFPRSSHKFTH